MNVKTKSHSEMSECVKRQEWMWESHAVADDVLVVQSQGRARLWRGQWSVVSGHC